MSVDGPRQDVSVVLVEPSLPENVGAVARVMDNLGFHDLRLVNPCDHHSPAARAVATHSTDILDQAATFSSLPEAVRDRQVILGTSARDRNRSASFTSVGDLGSMIPEGDSRLALVFGRESSGLSNGELAVCNGWVSIPTFGATSSLNLSHAVALVLYELTKWRAQPTNPSGEPTLLASSGEVEGLKRQLFSVLTETRFLRARNQETLWLGFADLIGRARPTHRDIRLLHGFFHRVLVTLERQRTDPPDSASG